MSKYLEALSICADGVAFLTGFGVAVGGEDDVEGVLTHQSRGGQQVAIRGLFKEQSAPQILRLAGHSHQAASSIIEPVNMYTIVFSSRLHSSPILLSKIFQAQRIHERGSDREFRHLAHL